MRYIGVNAPEVSHATRWWPAGGAKAHTVNWRLVGGKTVKLEIDIRPRDTHGRLLAYVWLTRNGKRLMANAEMVRRGYAQVMTIPPNVRYRALFLRLQREARKAGRGLWRRG